MTFASPFWLLGLLPVAVAAVLVFVRPAQSRVIVGSLALWQQAARSVSGGGARTTRRIPSGWALLLCGATLAVLALSGPIWRYEANGPDKTTPSHPPTATPTITFDALAGEIRPDGKAELFVRLRNHRDQPFVGSLTIEAVDAAGPEQAVSLTIPPRGTWQAVPIAPDSPTMTVRVKNEAGEAVATAEVRKIHPGLTRVATMGNVGAVLHRYIQADARLTLVTTPAEANVVLTQETAPPKDAAALILAPPSAPPGWRESEHRLAVAFDQADVAGDDPVMEDVNTAAMAVRRLPLWRPGDRAAGKALLLMDNEAVIVRSTPEQDPSNRTPRRVYVAFAISAENTNIEDAPSPFVTLLANAIRWLHPAGNARGRYVRETLKNDNKPWHPQEQSDSTSPTVLVGAFSRNTEAPTSSFLKKTRLKAPLELTPWLIVAAMLCWMLGWWRCGRKAA